MNNMGQEVQRIYSYEETDNPYSQNEEISVELVKNNKGEEYISIFVKNDLNDGCGIFLSNEQAKEMANIVLSNINV